LTVAFLTATFLEEVFGFVLTVLTAALGFLEEAFLRVAVALFFAAMMLLQKD
jgi:hypothetical protein